MKSRGFTLIELLIVVAIIAILAAIAVPNFLEAQTRAKVSRCVADMRTLATALETYQVDHNKPMTAVREGGGGLANGPSLVNSALIGNAYVSYRFKRLTTPVAYMTTVLQDIFAKSGRTKQTNGQPSPNYDTFDYLDYRVSYPGGYLHGGPGANWWGGAATSGGAWRVASAGPDNIQAYGGQLVGNTINPYGVDYDASNGTISRGDIVRVGGVGPMKTFLPAINRVTGQVHDPALK